MAEESSLENYFITFHYLNLAIPAKLLHYESHILKLNPQGNMEKQIMLLMKQEEGTQLYIASIIKI